MWAPTAYSSDFVYNYFARALKVLVTEQQVDAKTTSASTHTVSQSEVNGGHIRAIMPGKVVLDTYYTIYVQETDEQFRSSDQDSQGKK